MKKPKNQPCPFCGRMTALTYHHYIPRKMHRRTYFRKNFTKRQLAQGVWICRLCHDGIHDLYDEMELAKRFSTFEALMGDPELRRHFAWVSKQK